MRLNFGAYRYLKVDGYGRLALGLLQSLIRAGHSVHPFTVDALDNPSWFQRAQGLDFSTATLQLMPPSNMRHLPGRSIGYSMHESATLPAGWAESINNKTQWCAVPSPWLIPVFREAGVEVPLEVVPGGINPEETPILQQNTHRPFTFGCLADRGNRKGFDKVWQAFYKAFDFKNKDVGLFVKCRPGSLPGMDFSYSSDPRMIVWRADVDSVADIYAQMDCFMFPSRCEGLGMPPRESAACGVPTVVTRYSGTADDCDAWATPLEKFTLVDSQMEGCGGLWAEPDLDEIIWRMQDIYEKQDEYKARALRSAQWLRDHFTYDIAADKLIKFMSQSLGGPYNEKPEAPARSEIPRSDGHLVEEQVQFEPGR